MFKALYLLYLTNINTKIDALIYVSVDVNCIHLRCKFIRKKVLKDEAILPLASPLVIAGMICVPNHNLGNRGQFPRNAHLLFLQLQLT